MKTEKGLHRRFRVHIKGGVDGSGGGRDHRQRLRHRCFAGERRADAFIGLIVSYGTGLRSFCPRDGQQGEPPLGSRRASSTFWDRLVVFLLVKGINALRRVREREKDKENPAEAPKISEEVRLLTEIRDLLKK